MPGRKSIGDKALTVAERSRRWRERHPPGTVRIRHRRPTDRRSRAQRWCDAVAELVALQDENRAWGDSLPESLAESATAEALRAIVDIDLDELAAVEPPRGYGRD